MARQKRTILIVDDDDSMRGALKRFVECRGYAPTAVSTYNEAISQADKKDFDKYLVDGNFPVSSGKEAKPLGIGFYGCITSDKGKIDFLLLTSDADIQEKAKKLGIRCLDKGGAGLKALDEWLKEA